MSSLIQLLDDSLLDQITARALAVPRLRTNHNFHRGADDNPHRFLNALAKGTYCPPHRHLEPPKCEAFLLLRGTVVIFVFNDAGRVIETYRLGSDGLLGVDIPPGVWHSIAVLSQSAVCYEVKPGPWDPTADKELAPWAPREGDSTAPEYLESLLNTLGDVFESV